MLRDAEDKRWRERRDSRQRPNSRAQIARERSGRDHQISKNFRAHDPSHSSQRAAGPRIVDTRESGADASLTGNRDRAAIASIRGSASEPSGAGEKGKMIRHLCEIGDFVRRVRLQARFGDLSRAPLRLLRLQLCGDAAECDWLARPADKWDADLSRAVGDRNVSLQALRDAIAVRDLLFRTLPDLYSVGVRVYRQSLGQPLELIITGTLTREQRPPATVRSLAMRAKLFGLRFWLDDGILENMQPEEYAVNA
jgi:hypothetical protein